MFQVLELSPPRAQNQPEARVLSIGHPWVASNAISGTERREMNRTNSAFFPEINLLLFIERKKERER
jgi:hypothetical protein